MDGHKLTSKGRFTEATVELRVSKGSEVQNVDLVVFKLPLMVPIAGSLWGLLHDTL